MSSEPGARYLDSFPEEQQRRGRRAMERLGFGNARLEPPTVTREGLDALTKKRLAEIIGGKMLSYLMITYPGLSVARCTVESLSLKKVLLSSPTIGLEQLRMYASADLTTLRGRQLIAALIAELRDIRRSSVRLDF